ncbi:hypothetical protein DFR50_10486 [Roseiarcus fermentans]|uniref:Secreted protein n=1 Tax=Roseiarcus fermentans TaxID=1473586 RepID=A0A366FSW8_9HYPH|nr:hypothetical protein DFR50_10486 [Roseiarcus fermentans]
MRSVLKSLLVFLLVAAFGVAPIGTATASPCAEHPARMLRVAIGPELTTGCKPAATELARRPAPHRDTRDQCPQACCVSTTSAALPGVATAHAASPVASEALAISDGKIPTGIAIAPLTGPPKPSA